MLRKFEDQLTNKDKVDNTTWEKTILKALARYKSIFYKQKAIFSNLNDSCGRSASIRGERQI